MKVLRSILWIAFLVVLAGTQLGAHAQAQNADGIAVIVNDDIITMGDVNNRMDVIINSSNLPNTEEFRERLRAQVIDALIIEQIQLQEADALDIDVTNDQIKSGFQQIASQNNLQVDEFIKILKRQGFPISSMARQIKSQIAWGQVIQRKLRSQVAVTDADINSEIDRMRRLAGQDEYLVAEIFLPVVDEAERDKVRALANRLVGQIKKGTSFSSLARQFSATAGAAQGGVIGWVNAETMDPDIAGVLENMNEGTVSDPILTSRGYTIIQLRNKRRVDFSDPDDVVFQLKELLLPYSNDGDTQTEKQAMALAQNLTGCIDIELKAQDWSGADLREFSIRVGELPGDDQTRFLNANIGAPILDEAYSVADGAIAVRMVCGKDMPEGKLPDREAIRQEIGTKRIDVLQRGYLRDLKSQAYIEQRI